MRTLNRGEPEFAASFADIEQDMARQRGALAARPKGAPLDADAAQQVRRPGLLVAAPGAGLGSRGQGFRE